MNNVAILGFGTVGKQVFEGLKNSKLMKVVAIAEKDESKLDDEQKKLLSTIDKIIMNEDIDLVFECLGGIEFAYCTDSAMLQAGKHVVTSNKDLMCAYGDKLFEIATNNSLKIGYSAAVGGSIPIIRNLTNYYFEDIKSITAICNGTTNYMLCAMEKGMTFKEALVEAQKNGFAEKNPSNDVDAIDAARKLAIMSSIVLGEKVDNEKMHVIPLIFASDLMMYVAKKLDFSIKLLARAIFEYDSAYMIVAPHFVDNKITKLIENEFNYFNVVTSMSNQTFIGQGAGGVPTSENLIVDANSILCGSYTMPSWKSSEETYYRSPRDKWIVVAENGNKKITTLGKIVGSEFEIKKMDNFFILISKEKYFEHELQRKLDDVRMQGLEVKEFLRII